MYTHFGLLSVGLHGTMPINQSMGMHKSMGRYKQWTWGPRTRDLRTHGDPALFGSLCTSQLVLGASTSSLAANLLFAHHDLHMMFIN